jgi:hypothetical protein
MTAAAAEAAALKKKARRAQAMWSGPYIVYMLNDAELQADLAMFLQSAHSARA